MHPHLVARLTASTQSHIYFPVSVFRFRHFPLLGLLGSLLCGVAAELGLGGRLDGSVGSADGAGTGNGSLAEIGAVTGLGGLVGDGFVDLAAGFAAGKGGLGHAGGGLVGTGNLLAEDDDGTLITSGDTDSLVVEETGILAGVQVGEVEGVTGELETTAGRTLHEVSILEAGNLPEKVSRDVGHLERLRGRNGLNKARRFGMEGRRLLQQVGFRDLEFETQRM